MEYNNDEFRRMLEDNDYYLKCKKEHDEKFDDKSRNNPRVYFSEFITKIRSLYFQDIFNENNRKYIGKSILMDDLLNYMIDCQDMSNYDKFDVYYASLFRDYLINTLTELKDDSNKLDYIFNNIPNIVNPLAIKTNYFYNIDNNLVNIIGKHLDCSEFNLHYITEAIKNDEGVRNLLIYDVDQIKRIIINQKDNVKLIDFLNLLSSYGCESEEIYQCYYENCDNIGGRSLAKIFLDDFSFFKEGKIIFKYQKDSVKNDLTKIIDFILKSEIGMKYGFSNIDNFGDVLSKFLYNDSSLLLNNLNEKQKENIYNNLEKICLNYNELNMLIEKFPVLEEKVYKNSDLLIKILSNDGNFSTYPEILNKMIKYGNLDENIFYSYIIMIEGTKNRDNKLIISNSIIGILNSYPEIENVLMHNSLFLKYISSNKKDYALLFKKYGIKDNYFDELEEGLNKIQTVRPEISFGNKSLNNEMLNEEFINIVGLENINMLLRFDTKASDIIVSLYNSDKTKLVNILRWIDYVKKFSNNDERLIHYAILSFEKMEGLINSINYSSLDNNELSYLINVINNGNRYELTNRDELLRYNEIRLDKILNKTEDELDVDKKRELLYDFWSIKSFYAYHLYSLFGEKKEYLEFELVKNDVINQKELDYILKLNYFCSVKVSKNDIELLLKNNKSINVRVICDRVINYLAKKQRNEFSSLNKLREEAKKSDKVIIRYVDGVEVIELNGYPFRLIDSVISRGKSTFTDDTMAGKFEQDIIYGERLKDLLGRDNVGKNYSGDIILDNPMAWNLIEGISLISAGTCNPNYFNFSGYGWSRDSDLSIYGEHGFDAGASHTIRGIGVYSVTGKLKFNSSEIAYNNQRGEVFFDRYDFSQKEHNSRIQPEFLINGTVANAKYFKCPIVTVNTAKYGKEFRERIYLESLKKLIQSFDMRSVKDIWFLSDMDKDKKYESIVDSVKLNKDSKSLLDNIIALKWFFYETGESKYYNKVSLIEDEIRNIHSNLNIEEKDVKHR